MNVIKDALPAVRDSMVYVDALNRLAMLSHLRFRDSCLVYAKTAREIAVRLNYQKGVADAMNCQGIYYMSANNYLSAKLFNDALKIYQIIGDQSNEAQLLMNIGVLMFVSNNRQEALQYIYRANDRSKGLKNDSIRSIILSDIITLDNKLSESTKDSIYREGLGIAQKYSDMRMIISFENNEGTMLYNKGQKQKGVEILLKSLHKADSIGCEYIKVAAYMTLGEMMLDLGRDKDGIDYYKKGLQISDDYGYPERYLMLAERLYNYYKGRNEPEKAYQYASLLLAKHGTTSEELKKSGYSYLSFVLKENELAQLKKDEKIRNNWFLVMSGFTILILVVLFFVYQSLRNKKKRIAVESALNLATEQRNRELQEAADFRNMIISVIAHDVRQPFSSISILAEIFNASAGVTEDEKREIMTQLQYISSNTMAFMDGILSWIKSRNEGVEVITAVLDVKSTLVEANSFFIHEQDRKGIKLEIDIPDGFKITVHEQMTLFVFRNLLNNATKVSPRAGKIQINATKDRDFVTIAVRDNGPGMTSLQISELFKPGKNSTHSGGAGLALNISYDMVSKMKGRIWAESEPQKGAAFFVSLPVS
jgi:signal transduction histidine kinase